MNIVFDLQNKWPEDNSPYPETTENVKVVFYVTVVSDEDGLKVGHMTSGVGELTEEERESGIFHAIGNRLLMSCNQVLDNFGVAHRTPKFSLGDSVKVNKEKV